MLAFVAQGLRVTDIDNIESLLREYNEPDALAIARACGLPIAAFNTIKAFDLAATEDAAQIYQFFVRFDLSTRTANAEEMAAPAIDIFEQNEDSLIGAYARLLRRLRLQNVAVDETVSRLASRSVTEAIASVTITDISKWVGIDATEGSPFELVVKRLWSLAMLSRSAHLLNLGERIPPAVAIASRLLNDELVAELLSICLWRTDRYRLVTEKATI